MEQLFQIFDRDRIKAKTFMKEVKGYLRLNAGVNGFNSPMKKMAFVLTLIKENDVQSWVEDMEGVLDQLNPLTDNIPKVWDQFCGEFRDQFLDTSEQKMVRTDL